MTRTGWEHEKLVPVKSRVSFFINLNPRDPRPIHVTSAVRVLVLLFSFSSFNEHRSLKAENENNSLKT